MSLKVSSKPPYAFNGPPSNVARTIDGIVREVLYDGAVLCNGSDDPQPCSSQSRPFQFTGIYPAHGEKISIGGKSFMQLECLLHCPGGLPRLRISGRFLHPIRQESGFLARSVEPYEINEPRVQVVPRMFVGGRLYETVQGGVERHVNVSLMPLDWSLPRLLTFPFFFPKLLSTHPIRRRRSGVDVVRLTRQEAVEGIVELCVQPVELDCFKITVRVVNRTLLPPEKSNRDEIIMRTLVSAHIILHAERGEFISMMDASSEFRSLTSTCKNIGTWPVLVGDETHHQRNTMLSSPVVLYDFPKIPSTLPSDDRDIHRQDAIEVIADEPAELVGVGAAA